jgi:hypothetical protein
MAKRVIVGRAGDGSEYGLYVSKSGTDVIDGNDDLAAPEDLLFDSRRKETGGNVLASGTVSLTYSGSNLTAESSNTSFPVTYDYVPLMLFSRVSGNNIYTFNTFHTFFTTVINGNNFEQDPASCQGWENDTYAVINKDKFVLKSRRFIHGGTTYGLANGTHTFVWAALAVGEASLS